MLSPKDLLGVSKTCMGVIGYSVLSYKPQDILNSANRYTKNLNYFNYRVIMNTK